MSLAMAFCSSIRVRGETFVPRTITRGIANIEVGLEETIYLGNLDAKRGWGQARHGTMSEVCICRFLAGYGGTRSVREFVEVALTEVDRTIEWNGKGVEEIGVDKKSGKTVVRIAPTYFRPTEVDLLVGEASKAHQKLGWEPRTGSKELASTRDGRTISTKQEERARPKRRQLTDQTW